MSCFVKSNPNVGRSRGKKVKWRIFNNENTTLTELSQREQDMEPG